MPAGRGSGFFLSPALFTHPYLSLPVIIVPASSQEALQKGRVYPYSTFLCLLSMVPGETHKRIAVCNPQPKPYLNVYVYQITRWYGDH
jgi:hypothetical protein